MSVRAYVIDAPRPRNLLWNRPTNVYIYIRVQGFPLFRSIENNKRENNSETNERKKFRSTTKKVIVGARQSRGHHTSTRLSANTGAATTTTTTHFQFVLAENGRILHTHTQLV